MSLGLASASTQSITAAAAVTAAPFSVGVWVYPTATPPSVNRAIFGIYQSASGTEYFSLLHVPTSGNANFQCSATSAAGCVVSALTLNSWSFVLCRAIAAANRRASVLNPDGSITSGQSTLSKVPASIDTMSVGKGSGTGFACFDGFVGEYWITGADVQGDNGVIQDGLMRQLAYGGPFSVPHVAKDVIEYRSLRKHQTSDEVGETFFGPQLPRLWTNNNSATIGPHPPLPYWYVKPNQVQTELVV